VPNESFGDPLSACVAPIARSVTGAGPTVTLLVRCTTVTDTNAESKPARTQIFVVPFRTAVTVPGADTRAAVVSSLRQAHVDVQLIAEA
jgi:hypothetical protein